MTKESVVTVRLTQEEIHKLKVHTQGQITRSQIIRTLIQDFLKKTQEEQQKFLIQKLLWPKS
jgi:metal-responsive CopG/Arc/MetJ family transcriptional regulator